MSVADSYLATLRRHTVVKVPVSVKCSIFARRVLLLPLLLRPAAVLLRMQTYSERRWHFVATVLTCYRWPIPAGLISRQRSRDRPSCLEVNGSAELVVGGSDGCFVSGRVCLVPS